MKKEVMVRFYMEKPEDVEAYENLKQLGKIHSKSIKKLLLDQSDNQSTIESYQDEIEIMLRKIIQNELDNLNSKEPDTAQSSLTDAPKHPLTFPQTGLAD